MVEKKPASKRAKTVRMRLGFFLCAILFCVSAGMLLLRQAQLQKENRQFLDLSAQRNQEKQTLSLGESAAPSQQDAAQSLILPQLRTLYAQNQDLFGWIQIEHTQLNYPVMFTPEQPEYYLTHSFDQRNAASGVPFVGAGYQAGSANIILYGHRMNNGSMFSTILNYEKETFWKEHPLIRFDTLYEQGDYELLAAFYAEVYPADRADAFRYYRYCDIQTEAVFEDYVERCKAASLYDTGVNPVYGDRLITLSTCRKHTEQGRFVIVARAIDLGRADTTESP